MKSILIFILIISKSSWAFTLNNSASAAFEEDEVNVYFADNCQRISLTTSEWLSIIDEATQKFWNTVPSSRLKLIQAGVKSVSSAFYNESLCTNSSSSCDVNENLKVDSGVLITCNDETTKNFTSSQILGKSLPNNTDGDKIRGAIVIINDTASNQFEDMSNGEKVSTIAHELGHSVGLGHSEFKESLMFAKDIGSRNLLDLDDIEGISYLYPKEQPFGGFCSQVEFVTSPQDGSNDGKGPLTFLLLLGLFITLIRKKQNTSI